MALGDLTTGQVIRDINVQQTAEIRRSSDLRPRMALRMILPLDIAATATAWGSNPPWIVRTPFDGFHVEGATDASTQVNMSLGDQALGYQTDNYLALKVNDSGKFSIEQKGCLLTWSAQPGKVLTIVFFLGLDFHSGSLINSFTGSVSVVSGSSAVTNALHGSVSSITVTTSATQLCDTNLTRAEFDFYTDGEIWIGDSSVAVGRGIKISANTNFTWNNSAPLYAITAAGTATVSGIEQRN